MNPLHLDRWTDEGLELLFILLHAWEQIEQTNHGPGSRAVELWYTVPSDQRRAASQLILVADQPDTHAGVLPAHVDIWRLRGFEPIARWLISRSSTS